MYFHTTHIHSYTHTYIFIHSMTTHIHTYIKHTQYTCIHTNIHQTYTVHIHTQIHQTYTAYIHTSQTYHHNSMHTSQHTQITKPIHMCKHTKTHHHNTAHRKKAKNKDRNNNRRDARSPDLAKHHTFRVGTRATSAHTTMHSEGGGPHPTGGRRLRLSSPCAPFPAPVNSSAPQQGLQLGQQGRLAPLTGPHHQHIVRVTHALLVSLRPAIDVHWDSSRERIPGTVLCAPPVSVSFLRTQFFNHLHTSVLCCIVPPNPSFFCFVRSIHAACVTRPNTEIPTPTKQQ